MIALIAAATVSLQQWNAWKYVRPIPKPPHRTVAFVVPPSLYANAQPSLADLRVLSGGATVPFAIVSPAPIDVIWTDGTLFDSGYVCHQYSQVVADFGADRAPYDDVEIATTESSFATHASVEASDDLKTWRTIRIDAPIYDYSTDGLATNLRVSIPVTTSRYVRVRVAGSQPFHMTGIRVARTELQPRELTRYQVTLHDVTPSGSKDSIFELTGIQEVPIERVEVDAATAPYARDAELQTYDGTTWTTLQHTQLLRNGREQSRAFDFEESQASRWRLVVHNGDDQSLRGVVVRAFGAPRRIVFDAQGDGYDLIYGNPNAEAASFDYETTHPNAITEATLVPLGRPEVNAAYVPESKLQPWSERNRWILWAGVALAVLAIGSLSVRALRSDDTPEST